MRKLKLLLLLLTLICGSNVTWAQTDVTSTYLTNAGFDDCTAETSDVAAKTIKNYSSNGWTNANKGDYTTIAVTAYGGGKKLANSTTPSTKKDGTVSGNTLGIIAGWADDVKIQSGDITLPAGVYTLTVDHYLTSSTNNYSTSRFGFVTSSTSYLVSNTTFTASTWTTETVSFTLTESTTGKIQIGLKGNNNSGSGAPAVFYDDVKLAYTSFETIWNNKKVAAQATLEDATYTNITGAERTAVTTAMAATPTTGAEYEDAFTALETAVNAFTASLGDYTILDAEKTKAAALGMTQEAIAAVVSTDNTAVANTQALKVAEYNYVTTNYAYPVALSDNWTSTGTNTSAATFKNEHWSGEQRPYKNQNDNNGQGWNAGSWTLDFNQDVTLPAGSYVFKVAGRRASGNNITMSLVVKQGETVLGTVSDFPQSNNTRGINKDGATAYDGENSEFANSGNGFGWEWRYVKFDLNDVATVNIGVSAKATASHQWISFGDYTLQATNADVAALLEALAQYDAALDAAQTAMLDATYVNVIGSEETALNEAIDADGTLDKSNLATVQAATTTLIDATADFTSAAASYDALVAAKDYPVLTKVTNNVGTGVFQYNATTNENLYDIYTNAKTAVDNYIVNAESTVLDVQALVYALDAAILDYNNQELNAPAADKRYKLTLDGKGALTFRAASTEGNYGMPFMAAADYLAQTFTLTQVSGNDYNLSFVDLDGNTRYICTRAAYGEGGTGVYGIRTTTTADDALTIRIQASESDNTFYMLNTACENNKLGSNGGDFYTDNTYSSWSIAEATQAEVEVNIATAGKYATRIFPFAPEAIDGVTFYSCEATEDGTVLKLAEVTEPKANVPYILKATKKVDVTLSGWGVAAKDSYTEGWLTGIYKETLVQEGSYVLQTLNNVQAFYAVTSADPDVYAPAYRAYLTVPAAAGANAFFFDFDTTGINAIDALTNGNAVIYDLQGRRVNKAEKGIYIVNGKKVVK